MLQDVASVIGPGGPPNAILCVLAERSRDQPAYTAAACCRVQRCRQYSAARPCGASSMKAPTSATVDSLSFEEPPLLTEYSDCFEAAERSLFESVA